MFFKTTNEQVHFLPHLTIIMHEQRISTMYPQLVIAALVVAAIRHCNYAFPQIQRMGRFAAASAPLSSFGEIRQFAAFRCSMEHFKAVGAMCMTAVITVRHLILCSTAL